MLIHHEAHEGHEGYLGGHGTPCPYTLFSFAAIPSFLRALRDLRGEPLFAGLDWKFFFHPTVKTVIYNRHVVVFVVTQEKIGIGVVAGAARAV
jgi:hypothetical protein